MSLLTEAAVLPELNNDCLLYIFSFLPIIDRIRIQRVCKRWRGIGNLPWQDMKRLNFCKSTWTTHSTQLKLSEKILQQVFQLCGGFLREIHICLGSDVKFCAITKKLEGVFVDLLRESCPNIQILILQHVKTRCKIFEDFAMHFNCITYFSLESEWRAEFSDENSLACFFQRNGNLRSMILCSVNLQGRCFRYLPFQIIEEITIDQCSINEMELNYVSKPLYNLKTFTFTDSYCQNFNDVFELISAQSNLRKLEISLYPDNNLILKIRTELHHLETLKLVGNILSADLLMSVSKNYKNLIKVTLIRSDNVTDESLIQVLSLPNLQYVKLLYMFSITDKVLLAEMPKLKLLKCVACPLLQTNGFRALMESSKSIETLHVLRCEKVSTTTLIKDAVQITKNRKSNIKLILYVPRDEIGQDINDSPQLQIKGI